MLTEAIRFIQALTATGHKETDSSQPLLVPADMKLHSLEKYNHGRYRERYSMHTSSIDAFITFTNKRSAGAEKDAVITSVDPDACVGSAIFNAQLIDHEPGHCDDTATCTLKPLPMWAYLMSIGDAEVKTLEQRDVIDVIRDWHDYIPDATKLVGAFSKLTLEAMSKVDATEKDFGRERSAMEKIDMKADGGEVPSDINVKFAPYDGFEMRDVSIGVSAKINRNDEILIRLRVRGYEALKLKVAEEFAAKLTIGLTVPPIIGTIEAA